MKPPATSVDRYRPSREARAAKVPSGSSTPSVTVSGPVRGSVRSREAATSTRRTTGPGGTGRVATTVPSGPMRARTHTSPDVASTA